MVLFKKGNQTVSQINHVTYPSSTSPLTLLHLSSYHWVAAASKNPPADGIDHMIIHNRSEAMKSLLMVRVQVQQVAMLCSTEEFEQG